MGAWWLAALLAFDHASVAARGGPSEAVGPGNSPRTPGGFVDLDEDDEEEELARSLGGANEASENEASKGKTRRKGRRDMDQATRRKDRRKRRKKRPDWQIKLAAGATVSIALLVVAIITITVLEEFGFAV